MQKRNNQISSISDGLRQGEAAEKLSNFPNYELKNSISIMNILRCFFIVAVLTTRPRSSQSQDSAPAVKKCNEAFQFGRYTPYNATTKSLPVQATTLSWKEAEVECDASHPGYNLLEEDFLTVTEPWPCEVVPFGIVNINATYYWTHGRGIKMEEVNSTYLQYERKLVTSSSSSESLVGALNLTSKEWWLVEGKTYRFRCALCQRLHRENNQILDPVFPPPPKNNPRHVYIVTLTGKSRIKTNLTVEPNITLELSHMFHVDKENITLQNLDGNTETKLVYRMIFNHSILNTSVFLEATLKSAGGLRVVELADANVCPEERTIEGAGHTFRWPQNYVNYVAIVYQPETEGLIKVTRECAFDFRTRRAQWTDARFWEDAWVKCWRNENQLGIDREIEMTSIEIHEFSKGHVNSSQIEYVAELALRGLHLFFGDKVTNYTSRMDILHDFQRILVEMILVNSTVGSDFVKVDRMEVNFLVADRRKSNPIAGFMVTYQFYYFFEIIDSKIEPIRQLTSSNIEESSCVAVVFCKAIIKEYERVGFGVYTNFYNLFPKGSLEGIFLTGKRHPVNIRIAMHFVFATKRNQTKPYDNNFFFDIHMSNRFAHLGYQTRCSFWDDSINDWTNSACFRLKSTRGNKDVFRCNRLNKVANTLEGKYILYFTPFEFNDFLQSNVSLWYLMVLIASLSLTSLVSIIVTAVAIKRWREDLGHKILLHMTASLASNLLLGLLNNFVNFDTKSYSCIVVGVARHYFYLAMFAWMLVLSALQLKRLLTFAGAKTTNYLLLKVSLFAWGIPTLVIGTLLVWDPGFYQSTFSDRGFCYPEGIPFKVTVQAPAAMTLFLIAVIFVAILARVFSCFGWGRLNEHLVRHGPGKKTLQLRRIQTSLFLFFLLGLTWIFHFLSEEGVIKNKFFFEYMFLLTASTHVFMLSLFFVFFDKATRSDWAMAFRRFKERATDLKETFEGRFARVSKRMSQGGKRRLIQDETNPSISFELTSVIR